MLSCNSKPASENGQTETGLKTGKGKYVMKSGMVEYKTQVMGMEATQTMYFEDYGAKETQDVAMEMMGMKINTITVMKDGFSYNYDPDKKTGTKTSLTGRTDNIDFENLTEEIQKEMKIEKIGTEKFLDKTCTKYSINNEKLNMKGSYLVWKGIALKTNVDMGGMKILLEATKITENADIPAEKFEIPADIKF